MPIVEIDYQFFTHHHYDHNVDFAQFALLRWDQGAAKNVPLQVDGPTATKRYAERLFGPQGAFEPDLVARTRHPLSIAVLRPWRRRSARAHRVGAKDLRPGRGEP